MGRGAFPAIPRPLLHYSSLREQLAEAATFTNLRTAAPPTEGSSSRAQARWAQLMPYIGHADVVASVPVMKQLFKLPYSESPLSLSVLRIQGTLVIDGDPRPMMTVPADDSQQRSPIASCWAAPPHSLGGAMPSPDDRSTAKRELLSKLVYRSTLDATVPDLRPALTEAEEKEQDGHERDEGNRSPSLWDEQGRGGPDAEEEGDGETDRRWVLLRDGRAELVSPPYTAPKGSSVRDDHTAMVVRQPSPKPRSHPSDAQLHARQHHHTRGPVARESAGSTHATRGVPPQPGFRRVAVWEFRGMQMALGSDLLVFQPRGTSWEGLGTTEPLTLALSEVSEGLSREECMDLYLDNVMASVPRVAVCYHDRGRVQSYALVPTEDIPMLGDNSFSPFRMHESAAALLAFLRENCTEECGSYWLFREAGTSLVQLFNLAENAEDASQQRRWRYMMAMLCYRLAHDRESPGRSDPPGRRSPSKSPPASRGDEGCTYRRLLRKCVQLLDEVAALDGASGAGDGQLSLRCRVLEELADSYAETGRSLMRRVVPGEERVGELRMDPDDAREREGDEEGEPDGEDALRPAWWLNRAARLLLQVWSMRLRWIRQFRPEGEEEVGGEEEEDEDPFREFAKECLDTVKSHLVSVVCELMSALLRETKARMALRVAEDLVVVIDSAGMETELDAARLGPSDFPAMFWEAVGDALHALWRLRSPVVAEAERAVQVQHPSLRDRCPRLFRLLTQSVRSAFDSPPSDRLEMFTTVLARDLTLPVVGSWPPLLLRSPGDERSNDARGEEDFLLQVAALQAFFTAATLLPDASSASVLRKLADALNRWAQGTARARRAQDAESEGVRSWLRRSPLWEAMRDRRVSEDFVLAIGASRCYAAAAHYFGLAGDAWNVSLVECNAAQLLKELAVVQFSEEATVSSLPSDWSEVAELRWADEAARMAQHAHDHLPSGKRASRAPQAHSVRDIVRTTLGSCCLALGVLLRETVVRWMDRSAELTGASTGVAYLQRAEDFMLQARTMFESLGHASQVAAAFYQRAMVSKVAWHVFQRCSSESEKEGDGGGAAGGADLPRDAMVAAIGRAGAMEQLSRRRWDSPQRLVRQLILAGDKFSTVQPPNVGMALQASQDTMSVWLGEAERAPSAGESELCRLRAVVAASLPRRALAASPAVGDGWDALGVPAETIGSWTEVALRAANPASIPKGRPWRDDMHSWRREFVTISRRVSCGRAEGKEEQVWVPEPMGLMRLMERMALQAAAWPVPREWQHGRGRKEKLKPWFPE